MTIIVGVLIAAALVLAPGCARTDWIDRTLVTVDVTGVWHGSMNSWDGQPAINDEVSLELQQQGPNVTGNFKTSGRWSAGSTRSSGPIEGSVSGSHRGADGQWRGNERSDNHHHQAACDLSATRRFTASRGLTDPVTR